MLLMKEIKSKKSRASVLLKGLSHQFESGDCGIAGKKISEEEPLMVVQIFLPRPHFFKV
jgi:hypothetical protein